jgi:hypothetical protein
VQAAGLSWHMRSPSVTRLIALRNATVGVALVAFCAGVSCSKSYCEHLPLSSSDHGGVGFGGKVVEGLPRCDTVNGPDEQREDGTAKGVPIRIVKRAFRHRAGNLDQYPTYVTEWDGVFEGTAQCGVGVVVSTPEGHVVDLPLESKVSVFRTKEIRDVDTDRSEYEVIRNGESEIVFGATRFTRPDVWHPELFDGLKIDVSTGYCDADGKTKLGEVTFSGVGEDCVLKDGEEKVCVLWGRAYNVRVYWAYLRTSFPSTDVAFAIGDMRYLKKGDQVDASPL